MSETAVKKIPAIVATTSVASLMLATMFAAPMTSTTGRSAYRNIPDAMVRYISHGFDFSTSTNSMMAYEQIEKPIDSAKYAAYEMFGAMRSSTPEERSLYKDMLSRISRPIDVDIFSL